MTNETITVQTENGKNLEVVVTEKTPDAIWIAIGEGIHNGKCKLLPTHIGRAYTGSVMGRELVYERSVDEVKNDLGYGKVERKPVRG